MFAHAVAQVGLSGHPEYVVWAFAHKQEMAALVTYVADSGDLPEDAELHPGQILFDESRSGGDQRWRHLEPAIDLFQSQPDSEFLLNEVVVRV